MEGTPCGRAQQEVGEQFSWESLPATAKHNRRLFFLFQSHSLVFMQAVIVSATRRFHRSRSSIDFLSTAILLSTLLFLSASAESSCRDPDVARGFGSVAYAANVDATIQYFGHSFFLITTSKGTRIVTDPLGPGWYPNPNVVGDVVTVGKEMYNHNAVQIVLGKPLILRGLSNYGAEWNRVSTTFKDTLIYNVPIHQNAEVMEGIKGSAFVFDLGTLCIAHLGDLSQKLTEQQIKAFGKVDIALTPIGGGRTMGPDLAREVLAQLKPKIAIPMHHRDSPYLIQQFAAGLKTQMMNTDTLVVSKDALPVSLEIRVLLPRGAMSYMNYR
jgi:L-ascorbate metabolism protein UlaG (beta-lactamase superfamily)